MKVIHHNTHGGETHNDAIFFAETMISEAGHDLLDGSVFAKKFYHAGLPDIYCRVKEKRHNGPRTINTIQNYIIEIESDLSKDNAIKKYNQFEASNSGCKLIIINLADFKGDIQSRKELKAYIKQHLLFVED